MEEPPVNLTEETEAAVAAAVAASEATTTVDPNAPTDRDIIIGDGSLGHRTNMLLSDIIRLHRILWKLHDKELPETGEEIEAMVDHITTLLKEGRQFELAGLKDVPRPFLRSIGRFLTCDPNTNQWNVLDDAETKTAMTALILSEFRLDDLGDLSDSPYKDLKAWLGKKVDPKESKEFMPEGGDAILLKCAETFGEKMYETQGGNKTVFNLASQLVTSQTDTPEKRVAAALSIMKGLDDVEGDSEDKAGELTTTKNARFLIRSNRDNLSVTWDIMDPASAAEFTLLWVFEVFLEKEAPVVHAAGESTGFLGIAADLAETAQPGKVPIKDPGENDVLFGRGGMTNSHPGNRKFRDIIALHRPDYIRAIKMDKPAVARKIVRAIRLGSPPGRFLKKGDDGNWYDVGDRQAAEKTSQGLRERSNAEKRQRSALREALRIRKEDMADDPASAQKKARTGEAPAPDINLIPTLNYVGTNLQIPLSLNMKDPTTVKNTVTRKKTTRDGNLVNDELNTEGLPPNAVDEEGNIVVTDHDILCGRGGLTNHHKGNKRFRDIVALHRPDYVRAPKIQKPSVARVIVRAIRNGPPAGRFLKKNEKTGKWEDIGDKKAAEKTSQALREKTNEEREKLKSNPASVGVGVLLPTTTSYLAAGGLIPGLVPPVATIVPTKTPAEDDKKQAATETPAKVLEEKEEQVAVATSPTTAAADSVVAAAADTTPGAADDEVTDKVAQEAAEALMEV